MVCLTFVFPPTLLSSSFLPPLLHFLSSSPPISLLLFFYPVLSSSPSFLLSLPPLLSSSHFLIFLSFYYFPPLSFPTSPLASHVLIFPQISHSINLFEYSLHDYAFLPLLLFLFLCLTLSFVVFKQPDSFSNSIFLIFRLSLSLVIFQFNLFKCFLFSVSGS